MACELELAENQNVTINNSEIRTMKNQYIRNLLYGIARAVEISGNSGVLSWSTGIRGNISINIHELFKGVRSHRRISTVRLHRRVVEQSNT